MSAEANQDQKFSRDAALIALAHARDRMAGPDDRLRPDKPSDGDARSSKAPATLSERSVGGGISIWRLLVGLGALVPVGTVVLAWHLLTRQGAEISFPTASVSKELVVKAPSSEKRSADNDAVAPKKSVQMEPPSLVSTRTEQAQSIASMPNQLTDLEREIVELKAQQAKMLFENSERDKHLEEAQELARRNVNLIKDLKSAQVQMGQDNGNLAAQLKASQEQVATLAAQLDASQIQMAKIAAQTKASQDQIPRIAEQRQRVKPLVAASSQLASGPANKPTPKPRPQHPKPQTQNPAQAPIR